MTEADISGVGCGPDIENGLVDPEHLRKIQRHPCFSKEAAHRFGRIHLPVAPKCNIQCNYCIRDFDCVNESRPGVTSQVLTPGEAYERVKEVVEKFDNIKTVGIAGPGEPLANDATVETFRLVHKNFPNLHLCLSSNGLLMKDKIDYLDEVGVGTVTVTMSAIDPKIGKEIYEWVNYNGKKYRGLEAAKVLLDRQLKGIRSAVARGMVVKVNSVMIPSVNDDHLVEVAQEAKRLGAFVQNIMPLIPQAKFSHLKSPTASERKQAQDKSAEIIGQMRHCRQCRSDAVGLLGQDISQTLFEPKQKGDNTSTPYSYKVAVTSSERDGTIDLHFGQTRKFLIYGFYDDKSFDLVESRGLESGDQQPTMAQAAQLISDCKFVITNKAGPHAATELKNAGIELIQGYSPIDVVLKKLTCYA